MVVEWLRIHHAMLGKWVQFLVWEDPTCHRATKPTQHSYWACALEPKNCNERSYRNKKFWATAREEPLPTATREKPVPQQRLSAAKNNIK